MGRTSPSRTSPVVQRHPHLCSYRTNVTLTSFATRQCPPRTSPSRLRGTVIGSIAAVAPATTKFRGEGIGATPGMLGRRRLVDSHTRLQRPHYRVGTPFPPGIGPLSPLQPFWPALASRWPQEPEGRAPVITCGTLSPELIASVTSASLTKRRPGGHRARRGRRQCVTLVSSARPVQNCPHTCII